MRRPTVLPTLLQVAHTVRVSAPTVFDAALGRSSRDRVDARLRSWSSAGVRVTGMQVRVRGTEHVAHDRTYVVMSNHQSNWDIIALYHAFPGRTLRMVAKQEMRKLPILGRAMSDAEFVFVDRGDATRARDAIDLARRKIEDGVSVWIAPEGTRSKDGVLGTFKKGGFHLALSTGTTILPCTVDGTRHVSPPGDFRSRTGVPIEVRFHAPIDPKAYGDARREALIADVRAAIASGLPSHLRT
ncbi:MAG: 1-acyl-sn-glycerol-3-phosphate acyltransferase [Sandaracinus sp.]|nr:1-acyl-sn-glycerol-3-phosphate acyltransferase [Sandaracinus sp.]